MKRFLWALALLLLPGRLPAAGHDLACNLGALSPRERVRHAALGQQLLASVEERRELANGFALRLPAERRVTAARWAALEQRCCPFFAFELTRPAGRGSVWLRITGGPGVKQFMRDELGW
ncbi:MAG TPA: hypothetical protein VI504_01550 [Candidatus Eisenbacteria bacterium]|jgi:hypothetical protein